MPALVWACLVRRLVRRLVGRGQLETLSQMAPNQAHQARQGRQSRSDAETDEVKLAGGAASGSERQRAEPPDFTPNQFVAPARGDRFATGETMCRPAGATDFFPEIRWFPLANPRFTTG